MKYSSTPRYVNLVVTALLFLGFGALGCFFSFFVAPDYFDPCYQAIGSMSANFQGYSWNFSMLLGVLGLSVMFLSGLGLYQSIRSLLPGSKDEDVTKVFLTYVAIGYVFAVWFFFNATLYYRAIGREQFSFWIVVFILLMIGALVASNVPMMKILEDKDTNIVQSLIAKVIAVISLSFLLTIATTLILMLTKDGNYGILVAELLTYTAIALVVFLLSSSATCLFNKACKEGTESKLAENLTPAALAVMGAGFVAHGTLEHIFRTKKYSSLNVAGRPYWHNGAGTDYIVMAIIVGSIIFIAAVAIIVINVLPEKKKEIA